MQIQINTDNHIENSERLTNFFSNEVSNELERFDNLITRVEVHFGDENSEKFGKNDKRCLIEVRIAKKEPIAVTDHADTIEKAFHNAIGKVKRVLSSAHEKMRENH
ncbi:HPF/RaiA family ribosome-associated protein [Flavobacterium gelidilacus]|uniref:HPF/RaiA family ribosome-associated protein n=1 Tax=Flavobacterium gelidilacus TaxID=206041 RepID=UPI0003FE61C9|nr:HPF/RaiA family ribosome-associated protein [Flavobacterium gelidilacus]